MPGSQELKENLKFNIELMDLLEVMKNVAVFQYRSLLKKKERFLRLAELFGGFLNLLNVSNVTHKFIKPQTGKEAFVMITSEEGFIGDLNFQVVDAAVERAGGAAAEFFVIGESGKRYLKDLGHSFKAFKGAPDTKERFSLAKEIKEDLVRGVLEDRFSRVVVYYPYPVSFLFQKVESIDLFPLTSLFPHKGRTEVDRDPLMESSADGIIEYLAEAIVEQKLTELLEDSKLAEYAARAVHLEKSGQELVEKQKQLKGQYQHALHELIDKNTRELFSSQIIIKRKQVVS